MGIREWCVVGLAVLAAAGQLITIHAAWRELDRLRGRRRHILAGPDDEGRRLVELLDSKNGVNLHALQRILEQVTQEWNFGRWTVFVVKVVAPASIAFGLASVLVAEIS